MTRLFTRREIMATAALAATVPVAAQENPYIGQVLSMEETVVNLLGADQPNTPRFVFRTQGEVPLLRAKQGEPVTVQLVNRLSEDVWLHFFGVRADQQAVTVLVPRGSDGSLAITFTPPDAGTFWFGPLHTTARLREMGLQGMLIVDPVVEDQRFIDLPLIVDDWLLGEDGIIDGDFRNVERAAGEGRLGNWYTINGRFKPRLPLPKDKPARLRLLNVCNSRTLRLQLKGAVAELLAQDGQPVVPSTVPDAGLILAPGQRADVVLSAAFGDVVTLSLDLFEDVVEVGFLLVDGQLPALPEPATLAANPIPVVEMSRPSRDIAVTLEGGIKGGLTSARVGDDLLDLRAMLEKGLAWSINGIAGPGGPPVFEATAGETLILNFENKTVFDQPLALHGHLWHQLEVDGQITPGQAWRDTAIVPALANARYVLVAERPGNWGLQSLVAERSDAGLFGQFKVLDKP